MTANEKTLVKLYSAFANADASTMSECYHPNITFYDPIFGLLKGENVSQMWKMLIEHNKGGIKIDTSNIKAGEHIGSVQWTASYSYSKANRKVINSIQAQFYFQNGLIIKHMDHYDVWKWSKQALGITGVLFGWTGYMQKKIQEKAISSLKIYKESKL